MTGKDDSYATALSTPGVDDPMSPAANGPSFGRRFGVALLSGMPGLVAPVGYIYVTTPATAVPAGPSLPLLALVSAVNPLPLLGVACLLGAYAAPRVGLRSYVIDRRGLAAGSGNTSGTRSDWPSASASSAAS